MMHDAYGAPGVPHIGLLSPATRQAVWDRKRQRVFDRRWLLLSQPELA